MRNWKIKFTLHHVQGFKKEILLGLVEFRSADLSEEEKVLLSLVYCQVGDVYNNHWIR